MTSCGRRGTSGLHLGIVRSSIYVLIELLNYAVRPSITSKKSGYDFAAASHPFIVTYPVQAAAATAADMTATEINKISVPLPPKDKSLSKNQSGQKSLPSKIAWYILRGGIYAASSLLGYNTGNKIAENSVDAIRNFKAGKELKEQTENMFISEEENNQYNM